MKTAIVLGFAILIALCAVSAAGAAADPVAGKVAVLQKRVDAQQKQINALTSAVRSLRNQVAESGGGGVASQVSSLQTTVTGLQGSVNTLSATLTCRVAQFGTFDYGVVDLFAPIIGQPASFTGQVVPDNGTCAQVGLNPPSPAPDRYVGGSDPAALDMALAANMLGVYRAS